MPFSWQIMGTFQLGKENGFAFESALPYLLGMWRWASTIIYLDLSFLICQMGIYYYCLPSLPHKTDELSLKCPHYSAISCPLLTPAQVSSFGIMFSWKLWLHSNSVPLTSHSLGGSPPQLPVMKLLFFLHFCTKQLTSCLCSPHSSANNKKLNIGLPFLQSTLAISSKGHLPSTINHVLYPVLFLALSSIKKKISWNHFAEQFNSFSLYL